MIKVYYFLSKSKVYRIDNEYQYLISGNISKHADLNPNLRSDLIKSAILSFGYFSKP